MVPRRVPERAVHRGTHGPSKEPSGENESNRAGGSPRDIVAPAWEEGGMAPSALPTTPPERGIFCNRTLNLRSIRAIGYDMDYTLVHYRVAHWEQRAYEHLRDRLAAEGWPVNGLSFDPQRVIRGLIIDTEKGNLIKANRFGFVKKAVHGTRALDYEEQRKVYARTIIDLSEPRWSFLNTLFSLSEACMYAQLVDLLDERALPGVMGYRDLHRHVRETMDAA